MLPFLQQYVVVFVWFSVSQFICCFGALQSRKQLTDSRYYEECYRIHTLHWLCSSAPPRGKRQTAVSSSRSLQSILFWFWFLGLGSSSIVFFCFAILCRCRSCWLFDTIYNFVGNFFLSFIVVVLIQVSLHTYIYQYYVLYVVYFIVNAVFFVLQQTLIVIISFAVSDTFFVHTKWYIQI